jgi:Flp pilus assembly protein TadG
MVSDLQCAPARKGIRRIFAKLRKEDGSILIETSISFMIVIAMLLGIIETCMMGYTYAVLVDSAREGVRYASVHGVDSPTCSGPSSGCDSTAANVKLDVKNYAGTFAGNISAMVVTVTYPDGAATATSRVQVAISYTYEPLFKIPGTAHTLNVSSTGRILY